MSLSYQSLSPDFAVSPQLQPADMQALAAAGFKSVIINRPDGEGGSDQPRMTAPASSLARPEATSASAAG